MEYFQLFGHSNLQLKVLYCPRIDSVGRECEVVNFS
jgi:hypothetical protein